MNSANSSPPTAVQESAGNAGGTAAGSLPPERVPLPASPPPIAPPTLARADGLLAAFVVLLAFLVASTPARNSDLFLHLATGRALVNGEYRFGSDPFGHDSTLWVAHSWLFDLIAYALFPLREGAILVLLKAVLVALLAGFMVRLGTRERGLAWPVVGVALAVLAMSGRLLLQPALVSALLLAVSLCLLERARRLRAEESATWLRAYGPLVLLFALWANLDDWFLLGPFAAALYLLGEAVAVVAGERAKGDPAGLAAFVGAGLLACLLTPFHIHGFTLPAELGFSATARELQQDRVLQSLFISPFNETFYRAGRAWSVPGVSYLVLAALSGLSFFASRDAWRSWRLPVWLGLFALSAWSVRAVPFFTVAAGPILALNVQDFARARRTRLSRHDLLLLARLGRAGAILLLLVLLVASWPGWLQAPPYEMRGWAVVPDPSMVEAAQQLAHWREQGALTAEDRGFNFSPAEANYFAWYCPAEKGIVDSRLRAAPEDVVDYVAVRRALLDGGKGKTDWRDILRARRINHLIVYDSNHERIERVYQRLVRDAKEWIPLALAGRAAIFGWRDPRHATDALDRLQLSPADDAYRPTERRKAPREWPGREPRPPAWWKPFVTARGAGSPDRDEAALLLLDFETRGETTRAERSLAWESSRVAGALAAGGATMGVRLQQALDLYCFQVVHSAAPIELDPRVPKLDYIALELRQQFFLQRDDAPPEYLWSAIRAARRALHDNPDDAHAYLILGESYLRLSRNTRERDWKRQMKILHRLRQVQAAAALNQALMLDPDLLPAHNSLVMVYQEMRLWDLRLKHLRQVLRLTLAKGRPPGENVEKWDRRVTLLKEDVKQLEEDLKSLTNRFEINTTTLKISDRAQAAAQMGLGGKALEILLASDAASFGQRGMQLELHLLLTTGRVREVREWMSPDHRETLGEETYLLDRLELAAATGDYDQADAELSELAAKFDRPGPVFGIEMPARLAIALGAGKAVLDNRARNMNVLEASRMGQQTLEFLGKISSLASLMQRVADFTVLRGLMALERGDTEVARLFMERALELCPSEESAISGGGIDFTSRPIAEHYRKLLPSPPR